MTVLHFDGGKREDYITYGCVFLDAKRGNVLDEVGGKVLAPKLSSNVAEYTGLILGLSLALKKGIKNLEVYGDSQLIINQVLGKYRAKAKHMKMCHHITTSLIEQFDSIEFYWVPRKENQLADRQTRC